MPLARRLPKRGFNNIFATPLEIINLSALNAFEDGDVVNVEALLAKGILSKCSMASRSWATARSPRRSLSRLLLSPLLPRRLSRQRAERQKVK